MDIVKLRLPAWTESDGQRLILHPEQVQADMNEAADEIERLRAALKPFADAVYNDNGDMSVSWVVDRQAYIKAYFALRNHEHPVDKDKT